MAKTNTDQHVFISYRRSTSKYPALLVYKALSQNGYDAFIDYESIDSGKFAQVILNQIAARGHFILILSPGCLNRTVNADDWLRKEIEYAIDTQRNIVPLLFDGFSFEKEKIFFTGKLAVLPDYNALTIPDGYFDEAMVKLQKRFLKQPVRGLIRSVPASDATMIQEAVFKADKAIHSQIKPETVGRYIQSPATPSVYDDLESDVPYLAARARGRQEARRVSQNPPTKETLGQDPLIGESVIAASPAQRIYPIWQIGKKDASGMLIFTDKRLIFKADSEDDSYALTRKELLSGRRTAERVFDAFELNFGGGFAKPAHCFWVTEAELYHALNDALKLEWIDNDTHGPTIDDIDSRPNTYL